MSCLISCPDCADVPKPGEKQSSITSNMPKSSNCLHKLTLILESIRKQCVQAGRLFPTFPPIQLLSPVVFLPWWQKNELLGLQILVWICSPNTSRHLSSPRLFHLHYRKIRSEPNPLGHFIQPKLFVCSQIKKFLGPWRCVYAVVPGLVLPPTWWRWWKHLFQ